MKIPFNKEWVLLEKEDYANYLFVFACWEGYTYLPKKWGFVPGRFLGAEYVNSSCYLFIAKEDYDKLNKTHFDYLFNKPKRWDNLHKLTVKNSNNLFKLAEKIKNIDVKKLSDKKLLSLMDSFQKGQMAVHVPRGPMWLLETPDNIISQYLYKYLEENKKERKNTKTSINDAFQILSAPLEKSILAREKEELLKIGFIRNKKSREKKLATHAKKYEWLEYGLQGKILSHEHFVNELKNLAEKGIARELKSFNAEFEKLKHAQKAVIKEYGIGRTHQKIFKIVQDSTYTRVCSKYAQFHGYYCIENLLKEIGKMSGLILEQMRYLAPHDYNAILIGKKDLRKITNDRMRYSLHISDKGETLYWLGSSAKKVRKKIKLFQPEIKKTDSEILKGQTAYNGQAQGRVKIINTIQEMSKMHNGNVLVSHMTNPDIVPAMKMAVAIVTDIGGITSHAAIVARELKKPCIIGTKVATQVLRDGDLIEVDANKGEIKLIKN
jgi:phosphohistidine swiveling domain-containing protein